MLLLAIDTAGPDCAVAVARCDGRHVEVLAESQDRIGRGHAERLMPMIEDTLAKAGAAFADLRRIAVTTGPGSFTGVRVGVAAARGLALALGIPAVGIGSLEAIALGHIEGRRHGTFIAALDAKRGEVYARAQDLASGRTLLDSTALSVANLAQRLAGAQQPFILAGGGAPLIVAGLADLKPEVAGTEDAPAIADVARLACREPAVLKPAVPVYARGADAKPQSGKMLPHR